MKGLKKKKDEVKVEGSKPKKTKKQVGAIFAKKKGKKK